MTWTVAGDSSKVEVSSMQAGDAWTEMVIADRLADV
jgi:hypothetical protein